MKITEIKPNESNPRFIADAKFEKLKASIENFPQMMALRPIVVDADNVILGGNMRFRALQDLGYKDIPDEWVKKADELTEEQKREFIIKDNSGFGSWDWDALANEWDGEQLEQWGLDVPDWAGDDVNYSDRNKEIDTDDFDDKMSIKLEYTEDEYMQVKDGLARLASTPEQAVWKLLGYE